MTKLSVTKNNWMPVKELTQRVVQKGDVFRCQDAEFADFKVRILDFDGVIYKVEVFDDVYECNDIDFFEFSWTELYALLVYGYVEVTD